MDVSDKPASVDREFLVNAFLARLAVYRHKVEKHYGGREQSLCRGEIALEHMGAIEFLARDLDIIEDLKVGGYKEVL